MAKFDHKSSTSLGDVGVSVEGRGVTGQVIEGLVGRTRGGAAGPDDIDLAFKALESYGTGGLTRGAEFSISVDSVSRSTRGGGSDDNPAVLFSVPTVRDQQHIAIVEDDGFRYIIQANDDGRFEIPVGGQVESSRGLTQLVGRYAVRVIGLVGAKAVTKGAQLAVQGIEDKIRPHRLRSFSPDDHLQKDPRIGEVEPAVLAQGPALLLIHGFNSASHNAFRFDRDYVAALHKRYEGRVAAFDHPSLCLSPRDNAEWLANYLGSAGLEHVDILAHSRGGLVARELLEVLNSPDAIRSILFVATPNNGTALADKDHLDGFLSMAANLTSLVPDNPVTDSIGIGLEVVREWVLGTAFDVFTGIECANPGSQVLTRLAKRDPGDTTLRAIASQYEPPAGDGPIRRAADFVMDKAFKGQANDLFVPTRSAYDKRDHFHIAAENRFVLDGSFGISHTTFWSERQVLRRLDQWLDPAIAIDEARPVEPNLTDPGADFELAARTGDVELLRTASRTMRGEVLQVAAKLLGSALADSEARRSSTVARSSRGTVVVLPGFLGSRLRVATGKAEGEQGDAVWLNKWALAKGRFTWLEYPSKEGHGVHVDGLMPQYAPLLNRLAYSWDVLPFAYDWRLGIEHTAETLALFLEQNEIDVDSSGAPIHFVGHSMGGLVARVFIDKHPDALRKNTGRVLQLGTPNRGSFAMLVAALGDDIVTQALAAVDAVNDNDEIRRVFCSFPSVYEQFPSPIPRGPDGAEPVFIREDLVRAAERFHQHMGTVKADERFIYVAGDGHQTPHRARLETTGKISFGVTARGDGRVAHEFGHEGLDIAPERTFFVGARHGDLATDAHVLDAIDGLLVTGTTDRLDARPASAARGSANDTEGWISSEELERSLGLPVPSSKRGTEVDRAAATASLDLATKLYLGGGTATSVDPSLRVRVVHCSMEQAKYAVAAGHYKGIPMEGAIAFLDHRLDGALRELQEFDLFPEEAGSARYVPPPGVATYPKGAIVIGLGEFGQLSSTQLTRAIERGTIEYALAQRGSLVMKPALGVSSVLIGTPGRYGLSVQSSIFATVQGVARAAARLKEHKIVINDLELIELYEGKAEEAAMAIAELQRAKRFDGMEVPIAAETVINVRPGGRPGSGGYEETGPPWLRLQMEIADPQEHPPPAKAAATTDESGDTVAERGASVRSGSQTLTWTSLGRSSQAERLEVQVPTEEIRRHVRSAVHDPQASGDTNLTLFEMLFPHDAKLELDERDNLHLLVDESTAWIPWELVTGRDTNGKLLEPLALRAGVLRQLVPREAQRTRRTFRPIGRKALVIGDPPGDPNFWPRLPGARDEANIVAKILADADFEVTSLIYDDDDEASPKIAAKIRNAFFSEHYRVIHIAGHGTFEEGSKDPFANGVVIGPDELLCAGHFEDRLVTPDLVFLNCCHIGRIDAPDAAANRSRSNYAELAASTSLQLMKIGVRAVVAAGWAVDDRAASVFAESFYAGMTNGTVFGQSVGVARSDAFDDRNNTWGAYQCYGDPDFQFYRTRGTSSVQAQAVLSPAHLVKQLRALEMKAGDADEKKYSDAVAALLRDIERQHRARFEGPQVWEAFASAYAEAGAFDDAVFCYRQAVTANKAKASIGALEQLANLESRLAAIIARGGTASGSRIADTPGELCALSEKRLDQLIAIARTPERMALKGSLYKRWANIGRRRNQRLVASREAYTEAVELARTGQEVNVYYGCLALQLAHLAPPDDEAEVARFKGYRDQLELQLAGMDVHNIEGDYYERAEPIDIRATLIISDGQIATPGKSDEIVEGFKQVFEIRSTAKQRMSVIDHYRELSELLSERSEQAAASSIAKRLDDD